MTKILGLDLGTNSIGWSVRETDDNERKTYYQRYNSAKYEKHITNPASNILNFDNEIIDYGVVIFKKGVGDGKNGEFSLAAERRKNRSKRRLYNAKRYRKWELLKVLVENKMCPLSLEELHLWSIGKWKNINGKWKNTGRVYPINNNEFQQWLAFDPSILGDKGLSENGKQIRKNPYDLRCELLDQAEENEFIKKLKTGRALYHLIQRRGFKSSRKNGQSAYAKNEDIEKLKDSNSNFQISILAKEKIDKGERFRASGVIQRKYFEDEFFAICNKQKLENKVIENLYKAIYFVRPLRSQKGLVGNCTLENGKPRIPISHPKFEEFRALQFINNIKWREKESKEFVEIPMSLKKSILEELFFRKLSSGKNKGKITEESYFKFDEIIKNYSEDGKYEFNYKNLPNVSTCPTIAALMNVFDKDWSEKFIQDKNTYGINWEGLSIKYSPKYGRLKRKIQNGKKTYIPKIFSEKTLNIDEIWHLLFDYLQTKDKQEDLIKFCTDVLEFDTEKTISFANIEIQQEYGSLSYNAISKILPFLQSGLIYSEAVLFANLKKILGNQFETNKELAKRIILNSIRETGKKKEKYNIVNGLIQSYFADTNAYGAKGIDDVIKKQAINDVTQKLKNYFGVSDWSKKTEDEKVVIEQEIAALYLRFLAGKQATEEKASAKGNKVPEVDYFKIPRLDEAIKQALKDEFNLSDNKLKNLYHPSDIAMYPASKTEKEFDINGYKTTIKLLESPQPPSKGWKNPMAMRTLHELRHLLNYLLKIGKIDKDTKIVVEMARELNDANKRWAIQAYQNFREDENKEFAKAIVGVVKQKYPNINENDLENINKVRLWWEQIENNEEKYREIKALKKDVEKYRLWKEQECVCMYTGKTISITELFDGTQTQIMHTFPASISFDNSLSNLTVGDAYYNNKIQGNLIPIELPNYNQDIIINGKKHYAIKPRLKKWSEKVKHLEFLINENKKRTRRVQDPESKKALIQKRHLLQFDYNYWKKKLDAFTLEEIPSNWKNSQLIDTQIISKYARAYLKTVFEKVDVQKGTITDIFKKIYQIKGNEQKDRSKHSHHAIDATTLAFIPSSAKREALLKEYFSAEENKTKYHTKPYEKYCSEHILKIENKIIINHVSHDKTLTPTAKSIKEHGKKSGRVAQGDSIRGQLHKETFFGAVKALERNEQGFPIKEDGKFKIAQNKNGEDEIWIVSRKLLNDINIEKDIIVDELLKIHILEQLNKGVALANVVDFNHKPIRHIRVRVKAGVGFLSKEKAIPIKNHTYSSKHKHKREYLAQNDGNYMFLLYEGVNEKGKTVRHYRILNLFDVAQLKIKHINEIKNEPEFQSIKKGGLNLDLKTILRVGDKVLLFSKSRDEISLNNNQDRLYSIIKFNEPAKNTAYLYLQSHIEARPDNELEKGEKLFDPNKFQPRIELTVDKLNCLFEGLDFNVKPDGTIILKV